MYHKFTIELYCKRERGNINGPNLTEALLIEENHYLYNVNALLGFWE